MAQNKQDANDAKQEAEKDSEHVVNQPRRNWIAGQFFKVDLNKDMWLSKEECQPVIKALNFERYSKEVFAMLDENADGKVSCKEFVSGIEKIIDLKEKQLNWLSFVFKTFEMHDINADGKLTKKEFEQGFLKQANEIWDKMKKFDKNNDGCLTFREFAAYYDSIQIDVKDAFSNEIEKRKQQLEKHKE